jgi:hypothetical protein
MILKLPIVIIFAFLFLNNESFGNPWGSDLQKFYGKMISSDGQIILEHDQKNHRVSAKSLTSETSSFLKNQKNVVQLQFLKDKFFVIIYKESENNFKGKLYSADNGKITSLNEEIKVSEFQINRIVLDKNNKLAVDQSETEASTSTATGAAVQKLDGSK